MKKYLFLSICCILFTAVVVAGDKNPCMKGKTCKNQPARVEELIFMVSSGNEANCNKKDIEKAMVEFYKWYLKNAAWINAGQLKDKNLQDVVPPFNISWQLIQQYANFIRENYPAIDTLHLTLRGNAGEGKITENNIYSEMEFANKDNTTPTKK